MNFKKLSAFFLTFALVVTGIAISPTVFAQTPEQDKLKKELADLEKKLIEDQKKLADQKKISGALSSEVAALNAEIKKKQDSIAAKNKTLQQLAGQITEKAKTIETLDQKRKRQEDSLADILRKKNQFDDQTLIQLLFSKQSLSDFLYEVDQLESINAEIQQSFGIIRETKDKTSQEKSTLEKKQQEENNVKYALESEKKSVEVTKSEKDRTLQVSKGEEKNFEAVIKDRQARIQQIRAELIRFEGSGIDAKPIQFGEAYDYAKAAYAKTGVRPAFILAIMQQETNFGSNVGGCYVTNLTTGDGKSIKTGTVYEKVMGSGSLPYFGTITKALGLDWTKTPVSCPIDIKGVGTATKYYQGRGYGGAMGYTQFIPSTWVLVEARVRQYTGATAANPWNPQHAVFATAIYLQDLGAGAGTYTAELNAACRYYGACSSYGSSVMTKTANMQATIDQLEQLSR